MFDIFGVKKAAERKAQMIGGNINGAMEQFCREFKL